MKSVLPAKAQTTLVSASDTFRSLLTPALAALPGQVAQRLVQMAEQTRDFAGYEAALHAEREIRRNDTALQQGFAHHLGSLLNKSIATSYAEYRPSIHDLPANTALRLVDTVEVEDSVLLMQIAAEYRKQAGAALQELDVRIANLFGQTEVRERENPFRPYLIAKSIALAVSDTPVDRTKVSAVTQHLAMALADQAGAIYRQVNDLLRLAGISDALPAGERATSGRGFVAHDAIPTETSRGLQGNGAETDAHAEPNASLAHAGPGAAPASMRKASALGTARQRLQQRLAQWTPQWAAHAREGFPADGDATAGAASAPSRLHEVDPANGHGLATPAVRRTMPTLKQFLANAARSKEFTFRSRLAGKYGAAGTGSINTIAEEPGAAGQPNPGPALAGELATFLASPEANAATDPRLQVEPFPNLIFENRTELEQRSGTADELITIDVVGMLFEFILLDQSVPAAIRAQIGRLQYYLLQVALAEPALMTESAHPARQLVNRIGTASLGAEDKPEAMSRVTAQVRELVDTLLADALYRPEVLDVQLAHFESFMRDIVRTQHIGTRPGPSQDTQRLIDSLEAASQTSQKRQQLASALAPVLIALQVPDYVREFLVGPWVDIIVAAPTPQDAVRSRELVPMLVWSVLPKTSRASRQQLLSALGNLVRDLKAGLQQDGSATTDHDLFLKRLMRTHHTLVGQAEEDDLAPKLNAVKAAFDPVLRMQFAQTSETANDGSGAVEAALAAAGSSSSAEARADLPGSGSPAAEDLVSLPPIDYLGSISTSGAGVIESRSAHDALAEEAALAAAPDTASANTHRAEFDEDAGGDIVRDRLCTGAEVEIDLDGTIQRGMLVWRDSTVRNMLLSFSNGRRPVAVSVRLFRVLLGKGRARFLEAEPLFDRAVFAVLDEAQAQQDLQLADAPS